MSNNTEFTCTVFLKNGNVFEYVFETLQELQELNKYIGELYNMDDILKTCNLKYIFNINKLIELTELDYTCKDNKYISRNIDFKFNYDFILK